MPPKATDVDPFLLKKWERVFDAFFDHKSGSKADWNDFYMVVKQVRKIYGADSAQMTYAKDSMKSLWDGLCSVADKNKDSLITLDEWNSLIKSMNPKSESKWFNDYLTFLFKLFDVSEDGIMDLAEYTDGMNTYGFSEQVAHEAFTLFAVDKKGKPIKGLTPEQWKERWYEYFTCKDKKALGNHLFGKL